MSASWGPLLLALVTLFEHLFNFLKIQKNKKQQDENRLARQKSVALDRLLLALKIRRMVRNENPNTIRHDTVTADKLRKSKDRYRR